MSSVIERPEDLTEHRDRYANESRFRIETNFCVPDCEKHDPQGPHVDKAVERLKGIGSPHIRQRGVSEEGKGRPIDRVKSHPSYEQRGQHKGHPRPCIDD